MSPSLECKLYLNSPNDNIQFGMVEARSRIIARVIGVPKERVVSIIGKYDALGSTPISNMAYKEWGLGFFPRRPRLLACSSSPSTSCPNPPRHRPPYQAGEDGTCVLYPRSLLHLRRVRPPVHRLHLPPVSVRHGHHPCPHYQQRGLGALWERHDNGAESEFRHSPSICRPHTMSLPCSLVYGMRFSSRCFLRSAHLSPRAYCYDLANGNRVCSSTGTVLTFFASPYLTHLGVKATATLLPLAIRRAILSPSARRGPAVSPSTPSVCLFPTRSRSSLESDPCHVMQRRESRSSRCCSGCRSTSPSPSSHPSSHSPPPSSPSSHSSSTSHSTPMSRTRWKTSALVAAPLSPALVSARMIRFKSVH